MKTPMTHEEHKAHHVKLHANLDELLSDWLLHEPTAPNLISPTFLQRPIVDLVEWSQKQMRNPSEKPPGLPRFG
jgi:hypothetical protein